MLRKPFATSHDQKASVLHKYQTMRAKAAHLPRDRTTPTSADPSTERPTATYELSTKPTDLPRQMAPS